MVWQQEGKGKVLEAILVGALYFAAMSLPALLLVRFVRNRFLVVAGILVSVFVASYYLYIPRSQPIIEEIRKNDIAGVLKDILLISSWTIALRAWVWALISILCGFYAVRRTFSYSRLIAGTVTGGLGFGLLMMPFVLWERWWLAPFCYSAFAVLLVSLPLQRAGFERLLGIRLGPAPAAEPLPVSEAGSLAGHFGLIVLAIGIACFAGINYFEKVQADWLRNGPPVQWHSAASRNAYDVMENYYSKKPDVTEITAIKEPPDYNEWRKLTDQQSSSTISQIMSGGDVAALKAYLAELEGYTKSLQQASDCDYMDFPGAEHPSYLNLREAARAISIRGQLAAYEGRIDDATSDSVTLLKLGGLFSDQPLLVEQMIGVALRNIGLRSVANMIGMQPDNRTLLVQLAAALDSAAPFCRTGLDYNALKNGELGLSGPIIPNMEIAVPAFGRAHTNALISWMNFDLIRLATALELYRIEHGNYPSKLDELVPTYLQRIPLEPLEGRAYAYAMVGATYKLNDFSYDSLEYKTGDILTAPPANAADSK